jgi:hypothetical protein
VNDLTYTLKNKRTINPFSLTVNAQAAEHMSKASVTATYNISIRNDKAFEFRLFAGKMFSNSAIIDYRFRMSGQTGWQDYMYDNVYFGRTATVPDLGFQQFTETDGAFKVWSPVGQSDDWIVALNVKTPRPYRFPMYAFADAGLYHANGMEASSGFLFSAGLAIPVIKDIAEVYLPLLNSRNITDAQQLNGVSRFVDKIRFTFYLNRANPFEIIKNNLPF